jgi:long-subunit acyl-CoA synthetase (AMP-forming)
MSREHFDEATKVWSGIKQDPIYNVNTSVGYLILNVLKRAPERVTQVSADTNIETTCHEMRSRTIKIANYLLRAGLKQGDVVGVMATNSENLAPVVFACLTLGLPLNFLAPVMTENDVIYMFSKTKPKVIFSDANLITTVMNSTTKIDSKVTIITLQEKVECFEFVDDILSVYYDDIDDFV